MQGIKNLTFKDYKRIATQYFRQYRFSRAEKLPVNIEALIETAGHNIVPIMNLYKDFGVKGVVTKIVGGFDIGIDQRHYENDEFYFRFTLAEELAHIILHAELYDACYTIDDVLKLQQSLDDESYRKVEQQARALASRLLLPSELFDTCVLNWCEQHITELQKANFHVKEELGDFIAEKLSPKLLLSKHVLRMTILSRHPDLLIDKVLDKFGTGLIK